MTEALRVLGVPLASVAQWLGQDVGGNYGNAFVILKPLLKKFSQRILNTPLSESAIIGAATGCALLGKCPIAEMQFNDFVASGFNQLVNNTAKIFARCSFCCGYINGQGYNGRWSRIRPERAVLG